MRAVFLSFPFIFSSLAEEEVEAKMKEWYKAARAVHF